MSDFFDSTPKPIQTLLGLAALGLSIWNGYRGFLWAGVGGAIMSFLVGFAIATVLASLVMGVINVVREIASGFYEENPGCLVALLVGIGVLLLIYLTWDVGK